MLFLKKLVTWKKIFILSLENEYYSKYENDSAEVWKYEKSLKNKALFWEVEKERVSIGHKYRVFKNPMFIKSKDFQLL